jgi:hypothetical protein
MKYKTIIYTTVRAEVHHDQAFDNKADALQAIMTQELLDYTNVLGGAAWDESVRVTSVEIVDDEVQEYNTEPDEEYADE